MNRKHKKGIVDQKLSTSEQLCGPYIPIDECMDSLI